MEETKDTVVEESQRQAGVASTMPSMAERGRLKERIANDIARAIKHVSI